MNRTTEQLQAGDIVQLHYRRLQRTADHIAYAGYLNSEDLEIFNVYYQEPAQPGVWSSGNSGIATSVWDVIGWRSPEGVVHTFNPAGACLTCPTSDHAPQLMDQLTAATI